MTSRFRRATAIATDLCPSDILPEKEQKKMNLLRGKRSQLSDAATDCATDSPYSCDTSYSDDQAECKRSRNSFSSAYPPPLSHMAPGVALANDGSCISRTGSCTLGAPSNASSQDDEALQHWFAREASCTPDDVFANQPALTPILRETLVEWMCEVMVAYGLELETFLLAVNIMDRYLSRCPMPRRQIQLLGATCLWIASKYEEVLPLTAQQVLDMAKRAYSVPEMVDMESKVMSCLGWNLSVPTSLKFMHTYLVQAQVTSRGVLNLAECLLQLATLDARLCVHALPSHIAASALCMALAACGHSHVIPSVVAVCRWNDNDALATLSQELYSRFSRLVAPGAPHNCIVSLFADKQQRASARAPCGPDGPLGPLMVPSPAPAPPAAKPAAQLWQVPEPMPAAQQWQVPAWRAPTHQVAAPAQAAACGGGMMDFTCCGQLQQLQSRASSFSSMCSDVTMFSGPHAR